MTEQAKETFGDFDLTSALEFLHLFPYQRWEFEYRPIPADIFREFMRDTHEFLHFKQQSLL